MKKYENPIIEVELFDAENVVTSSGTGPQEQTSLEKAKADIGNKIPESKGTFTVVF